MAIAKKGLRKIIVGDEVFYWKFEGNVFVFRAEGKFSQLSIDLAWKDIWISFGDPDSKPNQMRSVTPKFVAAAISYAQDHGWEKGNMNLNYANESFNLAK